MYMAIDIGGTKTLLAAMNNDGEIVESLKFATPHDYSVFKLQLGSSLETMKHHDFLAGAVAAPGRIDRVNGKVIACSNLPWKNVPLLRDIEGLLDCPFVIENDTKVAGLSEALLVLHEFKKVLYVTISTGISSGLIINGIIDPDLADSESGQMRLEHKGELRTWESFASGKAIVATYGKRASDITDETAWFAIAHNIAIGLIELIAIIQPEVIVIGGGVGSHFAKFKEPLLTELKKYQLPLVPIPPIRGAKRAEEAVVYGCYELAKNLPKAKS